MSAPLLLGSGEAMSLGAALVVGLAFGFFLERAGFGNARKLAAQFYLTDLTVFKMMFTAIVTAMLGVFLLGRLGLLDLSHVYVPKTFLAPQLVGGLVFGIGFVMAGLCPGTSCVASATGRLDGVGVMGGMLLGIGLFDAGFPFIKTFYESTSRGALTLPALLNLPTGVVVAGVTALALGGFAAAEAIERRSPGGRVEP